MNLKSSRSAAIVPLPSFAALTNHQRREAIAAYRRVTGDARWLSPAQRAFDWFLGQNELQRPVYDAATGACHDGLHPDRINANQGAESTLSFLLALFEMRSIDRITALREPTGRMGMGSS